MNDDLRPDVDPWDLMVDHNVRIQKLEHALINHRDKIEELIVKVNCLDGIVEQHQKTILKLLDLQQQAQSSYLDLLNRTTPNSSGNH